MKKSRHKGFTLIELLVSVAILGILVVAELAFMATGANTYSSVFNDVDLQTESQTAMNQLEDYIVNCSGGLCFNGNALYVIDTADLQYIEYVFTFDPAENEIDYSKFTITDGKKVLPAVESGLMASHVKNLSVTFTPSSGKVSSVEIKAEFARQSTTLGTDKNVSPRNLPVQADTETDLIEKVCS